MKTVIIGRLRKKMGITQAEMAAILGISLKAVQSYEQGWRKIPQHIEKMALLLTSSLGTKKPKNCWDILSCPKEMKSKCIVNKTKLGHCCWAVTGTIHEGKVCKSWEEKKQICMKCPVVRVHFIDLL